MGLILVVVKLQWHFGLIHTATDNRQHSGENWAGNLALSKTLKASVLLNDLISWKGNAEAASDRNKTQSKGMNEMQIEVKKNHEFVGWSLLYKEVLSESWHYCHIAGISAINSTMTETPPSFFLLLLGFEMKRTKMGEGSSWNSIIACYRNNYAFVDFYTCTTIYIYSMYLFINSK